MGQVKGWVATAVVLLAMACAPGAPSAGPAAATGDSKPGPIAALDFSAKTVAGGQIEGGDLAGRDVVLWFWAPW